MGQDVPYREETLMRTIRRLVTATAAIALAATVAACSGGGSGGTAIGTGNGSAPKGQKEQGGTVTMAWIAAAPNFIFPLPPATNSNGYNENLTMPLWPYLVYNGDGGASAINPQESLYSSMVWSNGDKTITITLKPWKWSDGTPITSRDFTFVYNLLKANYQNWENYSPGLFPADVTSVSALNAHTVVLNLNHSYNPDFYEEDVLGYVPLLPQHAWDKTSMSGKVGNYDETTAGADAVWAFLQKEGGDMTTFTTNPLWKVVDGPWTLSSFNTNGDYGYVPNKNYSGPDKPTLSQWVNTAYTTDTAELDALRAGGILDVGTLPLNDIQQIGVLKSEGYSIASQPLPGVASITPNLYNTQVGTILQQLYVRQAMQYLIDGPQIMSKVYEGYADPGTGPVPAQAFPQWASPLEKSGGAYPYDPAKAVSLLKAHGWKVVPGGTSTCQSPGTGPSDCGAGITAGEALSFQLLYSSGQAAMDEQEAAIQSSEEQGGIKIALKSEPFNTLVGQFGDCSASSHPASACSWQLVDEGYLPYNLYPAGNSIFNTGGINDNGGYSSAEEDSLINATEYGSSTQAFYQYEDYTAEQLPWLWLPLESNIFVYKSNLAGFAPLNPVSGGLNPEVWYYTK
jgi:peptide/nickel transport system substrate-binding protein